MKFHAFTCLTLAIVFYSCKKDTVIQPDPEPASSFSRSLTFTKQNGVKKEVSYNEDSKLESLATVLNQRLILSFVAIPKTNGTAGDAIDFEVNVADINGDLVKKYEYNQPLSSIANSRYTYTYRDTTGGIWGSITASQLGVKFEGSLTIEAHDRSRKLISGSYDITARNLANDPTIKRIGSPIDTLNVCDLQLKVHLRT